MTPFFAVCLPLGRALLKYKGLFTHKRYFIKLFSNFKLYDKLKTQHEKRPNPSRLFLGGMV